MSRKMQCPVGSDTVFGPQINPFCRPFDFTLYFEDLIFSCVPAATFLVFLPVAIWSLIGSKPRIRQSKLLYTKIAALFALVICQIAILALRIREKALQTPASVAADVLLAIAFAGAGLLSYLDHVRSITPSTLLVLWLSLLILLGMARVRTLWLILETSNVGSSIPVLSSLSLGLLILSLTLESTEKSKHVIFGKLNSTPEQFSSFWAKTSFVWLRKTFMEGYSKILMISDLPGLDPKLDTDAQITELEPVWTKCDQQAKHSLLRASFRAHATSFLSAVAPRLCLTGFKFTQPFLINATIGYTSTNDRNISNGRGLIGAFALVYLGIAVTNALYNYQTFRWLTRLRGSLTALIYQQTMHSRAVDLGENQAITLMGTDIQRILRGFRQIHELWGSIIDIAIALWLLEDQVGAACIMPAAIAVIFVGIIFKVSALTNTAQKQWIQRVEERLKITSSMLGDMKAVKMLGLADKMGAILQRLRVLEIETSTRYRKLLIAEIVLSNSPMNLAPMATFLVFIIIAVVQHDHTLLTGQAFTSLSLVALMTEPVLVFIQTVPAVWQCVGCFDRIQEYCSAPRKDSMLIENDDKQQASRSVIELSVLPEHAFKGVSAGNESLISMQNSSFQWKRLGDPVLKSITVNIAMNRNTIVLGPVGSGKTTFLESILGETLDVGGITSRRNSSIAYCSQTAWLMNQSVRSNIIGILPFDAEWYATTVRACNLEQDFSQMRDNDSTSVGSSGINLSGGQKHRIALARAVYSRAPVVLLDDIFSGMDSRTVASISKHLLGPDGLFRQMNVSVVLATHSSKLLSLADDVIVLERGQILEAGSLQGLISGNGYTARLAVKSSHEDSDAYVSPGCNHNQNQSPTSAEEDEALRDLRRQSGDFSIYRYYAQAAGIWEIVTFLLSMLVWAFCSQFPNVWVKMWTDANDRSPNENAGMYMGVYAMFAILAAIAMVMACWVLFVNIITKSSLRLHKDLLQSTLLAPFRFFNKTDTGNLTNRFSQDMELIGMDVPLAAINYIAAVATGCVNIVILAVFAQYLGLTIPFVIVVLVILQKFYLRTSRQVRLLDIEAKAPLYTHFLESVSGAGTIRALNWQRQFSTTCHKLLDTSQRPVYLLYCIQQWLDFALQLIIAALAVILVAIVVTWTDHFSPGSVGVALITVLAFSQTLGQLITSWTQLETTIGAVARVKNFVTNTETEALPDKPELLPEVWPTEGRVKFYNVSAFHATPDNLALKAFDLSINAGEKVAICGRSGSGKTSLILSILQMLQIEAGTVTVDDINIQKLTYTELRARINVVPQEPFLMPGTVRFNIDPNQEVSDDEIIYALQKVELWDVIRLDGGLDKTMTMASWSVGQRQLLCLARAIVRKSKILILDEATSSVDHETEAIMQGVIDSEFADCTVLAVMHRLSFVMRYDKVALLDAGRLLEYDSPRELLRLDSSFAELYRASGYKDTV